MPESHLPSLMKEAETRHGPKATGWLPDPPDLRDYSYSLLKAMRGPETPTLPRKVSLRDQFREVHDQASLGSCTGQSVASMLETVQRKQRAGAWTDVSRLFLYWGGREAIGRVDEDSGAHIRDVMKFAADKGACSEAVWPYVISQFKERPPPAAWQEAETRQVMAYFRLETLGDMRECLAAGFPFAFGFGGTDSMFRFQRFWPVARALGRRVGGFLQIWPGDLVSPREGEQVAWGHAVTAVGYDDDLRRLTFLNSWSENWGDHGYGSIPYKWVREGVWDAWTTRQVEVPEPLAERVAEEREAVAAEEA